jgi:hypothetical protein
VNSRVHATILPERRAGLTEPAQSNVRSARWRIPLFQILEERKIEASLVNA